MQLNTILLVSSVLFGLTKAADSSDAAFLTAFVGDFNSNKKEYIQFIATATGVPAVVTSLALEVATYTDDSYTTLLDDPNINVSSLEAFATNLPWYTRIVAEADGAIASSAASSGPSASAATSSPASTTSAASTTSSAAKSTSSSATTASSSSHAAGSALFVPVGSVLAAVAAVLL
ncbi:Seripauperin and TIP1 family-domain-containing protein [Scheffersomyces coipomensis]|uniref:Seripauperin and TIP1 family-domain-containing protein n=1 Tax=Scheffersomyces coipomensis TaxID=1788519 RepID=UPI00315DC52C